MGRPTDSHADIFGLRRSLLAGFVLPVLSLKAVGALRQMILEIYAQDT